MKNQSRLEGGADVPDEVEDAPSPSTEVAKVEVETVPNVVEETETTSKTENEKPAASGGPCCFCIARMPGSTGDKKVDEMIDYVHKNLQEAGKALATLSDNFEHDSKVEP
ncbi:uncharacterized protein LOC128887981 [Hylaeus anthracinus]|uniref:uncharacterized protein LOC128873112 n=1 Tax=Hylaeus volcanicus TaxID=313075 RepID=UPI0023B86AF1|nr:uncharacterized protein LOC128873112 [Hylaeus volcanicus]XP_054000503.1 uncharacterized protein LOC128887981 [Hylaeus anthracinus]